jgi:hypothetical protein
VFNSYIEVDIVEASLCGEVVKFQFVLSTVFMKRAKIASSTCFVKMNIEYHI